MNEYSDALQQQLANLVQVSWVVLIPLGVLLSLVIYKILMLLQSVYEFWTVARHELSPAMQDLRKTASHVEILTGKAVDSIESVERGVQSATPMFQDGLGRIQQAGASLRSGVFAVLSGFASSFRRS
ncbi:MAG: hypothetical protein VKJ04_02175 [Vampirovibrionales bacterium]|nr:hypothetical protein [Vampirovibrionales bacterium]